MSEKSHASLVAGQFGPRAAAYVNSAVHSQGEDLEALTQVVAGQTQARVLDLGCGGGHVSFRVAPHVREVVAYDLSRDMLGAVAKTATERGLKNVSTQQGMVEKLPFADAAGAGLDVLRQTAAARGLSLGLRQGSADTLPFADASFDFVFSRFSAHHWHDFEAALGEARRVLKASGRAVFMDAISPGPALLDTFIQTVEMLRDPSHVRDYSRAEWEQALRRAGFRPGSFVQRRLRLDFPVWIARMETPEVRANAIRSLEKEMPDDVTRHFAIEPDGSFMLDTMSLEALPV
jgi:ubiquinone/menaquinone biosynthesis C-methylase UbiE